MRHLDVLRRVPRPLLFGLAAAIQIVLIAAMVVDRALILRNGTEVLLSTTPVDPRDFLRGDYVILMYTISWIDAGEIKGQPVEAKNAPIYVRLAPTPDGFFQAVSVHAKPVEAGPGEVLIRGRVNSGEWCGTSPRVYCDNIGISYGLESYFVPEGEGLAIERERNQRKVSVVAAVTPSGKSAIKRLLVDGKPVFDEPMF